MLTFLSHLHPRSGRRLFIVLALVAAAVTLTGCPDGPVIPIGEL